MDESSLWALQATAAQTQEQPAQTPPAQEKSATPTSTPQKASSQQQPPPAKRVRHKKRAVPPNCPPGSGASSPVASSASSSTQANADASGNTSAQTTETPTDTKNCPPSKVIVRQGGTPEPSIQLAGPTGSDKGTQALANQMLGTAEANLGKIGERQLTQAQQDMVSQIRQFIEQSKAATAAGDPSRARTLAWKAQTLSDDLVKPEK